MGTIIKSMGRVFASTALFLSSYVVAQKSTISYPLTQQDPRVHIGMEYQKENNNVLGIFTQDYRITVQNKTQDKLDVYIEYYAATVCGKRRTNHFGPFGKGYIMEAGESVVPTSTHKNFGYHTFTQDECPKTTWLQVGVDKSGEKTYNIISSMGYRIVKIINLSEQERKEAEAKKQKAEEEKKRKEAEAKQQKAEEEKKRKEAEAKKKEETKNQQTTTNKTSTNNTSTNNTSTNNTSTNNTSTNNTSTNNTSTNNTSTNKDFWGDATSAEKSTTSARNTKDLYAKDENFVADSKFKNNLRGVVEGEYFTDGSDGYYKKELGGARKVDKAVYDRESANKVYETMAKQEAERKQQDIEFKQDWDRFSSSFYSMSSAKAGLRDASSLGSDFESMEQLNAVFTQKMQEITTMSNQLQISATQTNQAYTTMLSSASSGYDYSAYTDAIGSIAAAISAGNAESDARAALQRQRQEEEAKIKARQLEVLIDIRQEINKVFTEGGMPLSSHKITAPVLYVFAYASNKADWTKNQNLLMTISNVIPVYRYSDGTYPYTSNVKQIFENAGLINPILMGYFTSKSEAENYRKSLVEVAPNGKFTLKEVEVKVKEKNTSKANQTSETDFWGTPTKDKKTEPKKETKKEDDFWSK